MLDTLVRAQAIDGPPHGLGVLQMARDVCLTFRLGNGNVGYPSDSNKIAGRSHLGMVWAVDTPMAFFTTCCIVRCTRRSLLKWSLAIASALMVLTMHVARYQA